MMKYKLLLLTTIVFILGCQLFEPTPVPLVAVQRGINFTLEVGQSAQLTDIGYAIKLVAITNDARCPSEIECYASGPVSLEVTVKKGYESPIKLDMQTLTSQNGQAPEMDFEGIKSKVEMEGFTLRILAVTPYPKNLEDRKNYDDYLVTFIVERTGDAND